ncbi:MAG: hypothetical protein O2992_15600 [Gemmatimonadetes bacterium]|nr:hypothetical protein [Gemmatimonadota bacterium]
MAGLDAHGLGPVGDGSVDDLILRPLDLEGLLQAQGFAEVTVIGEGVEAYE